MLPIVHPKRDRRLYMISMHFFSRAHVSQLLNFKLMRCLIRKETTYWSTRVEHEGRINGEEKKKKKNHFSICKSIFQTFKRSARKSKIKYLSLVMCQIYFSFTPTPPLAWWTSLISQFTLSRPTQPTVTTQVAYFLIDFQVWYLIF